jgi:hypothetical protein
MTKKDYIKIADSLRDSKPIGGEMVLLQWEADVYKIMDCLQQDNPKFDKTRFLRACDCIDIKVLNK